MHTLNLWHKLNLLGKKISLTGAIIFLMLLAAQQVSAQKKEQYKTDKINLPEYEHKWLHYGFQLGGFSSTMRLQHSSLYKLNGNFTKMQAQPRGGFNVGLILNVGTPSQLWDIRFLPGFSFYEHNVLFSGELEGEPIEIEKISEGVYLEVPVMLKYKSVRRKNMRMYVTGGMSAGFKVGGKELKIDEDLILAKTNVEVMYGVGFHFYMQMFNLAPEIRFAHGLSNMLSSKQNDFARSINQMLTHRIIFVLNFEG